MDQKLKLKIPLKADPSRAGKYIYEMTRKICATVLVWVKNSNPKNISKLFLSRRAGAIAVLIIFLAANFFQNTPMSQGAQYTFSQTDWSGGETANSASHPADESGWDEYSAGTNLVTNVAGQVTIAETAHTNFSETFTATTYKDATNTTANWNTGTGQVEMSSESSGVNLYEKLNGILGGAAINAQLKVGNDYYVGAATGKFLKYNSATDTATNLTSKVSGFVGINHIYSLAFDSANNVVYVGGASNVLVRYNTADYAGGGTYPTADTAYDIRGKINSFWSNGTNNSMLFDSANNVLYIGSNVGKFARYNTTSYAGGGTYPTADTGYDLTSKISAFWGASEIKKLIFDPANSNIHILGAGSFAKYDIIADTATNLKGKITSATGTATNITANLYADGKIYSGTSSGNLFSYDIVSGIATDLTAKISAFWTSYSIFTLAFDSANNVLYVGGSSGNFARYNTTSYAGGGTYPTADTAYNLGAKISSFWSGNTVYSLAFDSVNNVLNLGGGSGKFARYNTTSYSGGGTYPTADTGYDLTAKISAFWGSSDIKALVFDGSADAIYLGGATGKFARYNTASYAGGGTYPTADTAYNLTSKVSSFWGTSTVNALTFDSTNNSIYLGGQSGKFARYNTTSYAGGGTYPTADTAYDLTAKISAFWSTNQVNYFALDGVNNALYLGGVGGKFARYNTTSYAGGGTYPTADTGYDLASKISSFWSTNAVNALTFDGANGTAYVSGNSGKFGKYASGTDAGTDLASSLHDANLFSVSFSLYDAVLDLSNNAMYLGSSSGELIRYNTAAYVAGGTYPAANTAYSLTSKIASFWATSTLNAIFLDSANNAIYFGGSTGRFARYNTTSYAGGGTYPTADTAYDLSAKTSPLWSTNAINALTLDSGNNTVYLGGASGKFARYNTTSYVGGGAYPTADTVYDLTSKVNGVEWNGIAVIAMVTASNNELYVGGAGGKFAKYETVTGVATNLTAKISSFWSTNDVSALAFDSASNTLYLGGNAGKFARYNTTAYSAGGTYPTADTAYNLAAKISSFWGSSAFLSVTFDPANSVVYLGGVSGRFARYNTASYAGGGTYPTADTAYDLTAKISSFWSTNFVWYMTLDSASNTLYLGGTNGKLARYNTTAYTAGGTYSTADTAYDLTAKISAFWSTNDVNEFVFDGASNTLYLGGGAGKFARYNTTSYSGGGTYPTADTAYDLTAKISSFWGSSVVNTLVFDLVNNAVYIGGASGKFARYSIASDSAVNLRSPDTLSFWGGTNAIYALAMDASGKLYIGGASGYFAEKPAAASVSYAQSLTLDAVSWNIAQATLTKNDTPGSGSITYSLSNNGGSTWETFTPTVTRTFTSTGSDLRFKISVTGNATVQDVAITYWAYNSSGELTSSKYDATDPTNVLAKMAWTENLPAGTDVRFQLRTSADGNTWTAWCGPNDGVPGSCNSETYFTDPAGTETVDDINNDQANDRWFQYKAYLTTSDGKNTPTLSDATATYVVNAPPQVQNVTASEASDGTVTVDYEVLDPDTNTGVTQNSVAITLQYCTANCSDAGNETWADAVTVSGDEGAGVSVQQAVWNAHQLVWTPTADYDGQYNGTDFKVRIKAFDGELANHTAYDESGTFVFDTSDPVLQANTLLINDSATAVQEENSVFTLKLQNISGDMATEQVYAQFSRNGADWYGANGDNTLAASGDWGTGFTLNTLAAHSWTWTADSRNETISVRIKDGYNNISTIDSNSAQYNATPEVQTVTAAQGATGTVAVSFEIKDADTVIGATPNVLDVTLQYCTANCSDPGNETWIDAVTMTGDHGATVSATDIFATKNIVWSPKTDYAGQFNDTDFKVRIIVDDGESFHNSDSAQSSQFILDTKNPTNNSFTINHTTNELTLATPSDDSAYQMSVSNTAGVFSSFEAFSSPYIYGNLTADPATVYVRIQDAYGNYLDASATTPARPNNPIYFDISSAAQGTYQEFIAWDVVSASQTGSGFASYQVYRKIDDGSYSLLDTITDRTLNYYLDRIKDSNESTLDSDPAFDPLNPSTYYYKVVTTDTDGNVSAYSGETSDVPNGTGGSDSTPPTITNVQVSDIDTTSAVITWETDELANSSVGYSTDYTYVPERALASFETVNHRITLTGLDSNTTYHIRVISEDIHNNEAAVCYGGAGCSNGSNPTGVFTFTTDAGPEISSVSVSSNNSQATVSWVTSVNSDSYVVYSDTVVDGSLVDPFEVGTPDMVGGNSIFNHSQAITTYNDVELISGATYYFYVKSTDATNQTAVDNNGGNFYSFTTTQDDDAPVISLVNAAIINDNKVAINWTTDEPATSVVRYGSVEGGPYPEIGEVLTFDRSHYVILAGLDPNADYYYTVTSADINANEDTSAESSFTTLMNPEQQHPPLSAMTAVIDEVEYDLSDIESAAIFDPAILTDVSAAIDFQTDQIAMCDIQYRKDGQEYNPTDFIVEETGYNTNHSIHIMSLILSTKYYYKIECVDNLPEGQAGMVNSAEFSFTTLEQQYGTSEIGALGDSTPPTISSLSSDVISGESVTVSWETDEAANSLVRFGIASETYTDMAGDPLVNDNKLNFTTAHSVVINGLVPGIEYFFTALSTDASGNIAESSEASFTTGASSSLSSINITSSALGEALVTWETSEKISSIVEYGLTNLYGQKKEDTAKTTVHSVSINGLTAAQTYHLRVKGEDENGQLFSSGDYTFIPKSPPQIGEVAVKDVTEHEATVSFSTDFPTDYNITYTSLDDPNESGSKGKPDFSINHETTLDKLKPGTTYALKIKASDEQGNSVEKIAQNFTTGKDEKSPEITKARTESALAQSDKVQTIISWETNELSECALIYREGVSGEEREYKVNDRAALSHVAVVTSFKPGTVYYFKIRSIDEAGNESVSSEYALLTPQKKENIVQIIVNNFQDIFSWVDRV